MNKEKRNKLRRVVELLSSAKGITSEVFDAERTMYENIPENLQDSARAIETEGYVDCLEDGLELIDEAEKSIQKVLE